jgi:uncharacterized protein
VELYLPLLIFVAAALYASVGHAGASGYLAAMALLHVAPSAMKPSALVLNLLVATLASVQFARANREIAWRTLLPFALGSVPLAYLGGAITLPGTWYRPLVGLVLIVAAVRLTMPSPSSPPLKDGSSKQSPSGPDILKVALGAVIGLLAGLTGTGGGIFLTPLLLLTGWEEGRKAAGVSAAFILVNSLAGLAAKPGSLAQLPSGFALWAVAAVLGGFIGSTWGSTRLSSGGLRRVLAAVLVVAAGKLLFSK